MASPVTMVREDGGGDEDYKQKYCGAGKYVLLRSPTEKELELAQATWDEVETGKCCINDAELSAGKKCGCTCTFFPNCFPQAVNAPCCILGKIVTVQHGEPPICCGMGKNGVPACLALTPAIIFGGIPPGFPVNFSLVASAITVVQRERLIKAYKLKTHHQVPCCYPLGLYRHYMFLAKLDKKVKAAGGGGPHV